MDFGNFFGGIGHFLGGLFGGGEDPRKRRDQPQPVTVQRPVSSLTLPNPTQPNQTPATVQQPQSFALQPTQPNQTPQLGGVTMHQPTPAPVDPHQQAVDQAKQAISHGSGAPFAPQVLNEARTQMGAPQAPKPIEDNLLTKAAKTFYGGVNDVGSTIGSVVGSVIPMGDANLYSSEGRKNLWQNLQNETYNPATHQWFTTGRNSVDKVAADQQKGDMEALAGDLGSSVLNAASIVPIDKIFTAAKAAMNPTVVDEGATAAEKLLPSILGERGSSVAANATRAGLTGGLYNSAGAGFNTMQQDGSPTDVIRNSIEAFGPGAALGALVPTVTGTYSALRNPAVETAAGKVAGTIAHDTTENLTHLSRDAAEAVRKEAQTPTPTLPPEKPIVVPEPMQPITVGRIAPKAPAITSPNRPAPTVQQPRPIFENPAPVEQAPIVETPQPTVAAQAAKATVKAPKTAEQQLATVQKAIEDQATKPAEQPAPATVTTAESPKAAQTRAAAETTTPVNPEAVAQAEADTAASQAPTEGITQNLGSIARSRIEQGKLKNEADSQQLGNDVAVAIDDAAKQTGSTWEEINKKVQDAWSKGLKTYQEAGLTKEQYDVALKAADELSLLRSRVDPKLIKDGHVGQFYSPRQSKDTPFTQELVNELSRDKKNGLSNSELDLSTTPYNHAIRRYANATAATTDQLVNAIEKKAGKDANGDPIMQDTGIKVSDETKQKVQPTIDKYVEAQDKAIKAASEGDAKGINDAINEADSHLNDAIKQLAGDIPADHPERQGAIDALTQSRGGYQQGTIRTNMFLNVANRAFDQVQKGIVNLQDKALPIANAVASKIIGNSDAAKMGTGFTARRVANKYARGSLRQQLNRNFKTSVSLAGAGRSNPLTKGIAKLDSAYRAAGTYITSLGDTTTNAVRATNLAILGKAQAEGITGKAELEKYLVSKLNTPEYQSLYHDMSNVYAGYIGMPETITGLNSGSGKISQALSKADNAVKGWLDKTPLPDRAKQEINDLIGPAVTGFAGATSRIAKKSLNAMAGGIPQIRAGLKMAASDQPNAQAVGQMMIARSLVDAAAAGGVWGAGMLLGSQGHWTGSYPSDPNERARWEKDGIQPDSFKFDIGGKTVYLQPGRVMGALALPLVIPAVAANAVKTGTDPGDAVNQLMDGTLGQFMSNLGADALVQHIGDIGKLTSGNDQEKQQAQKDMMNMLGYSISNIVPASGLQNNIANMNDQYKRDTSGGIVDVVAARNPVTRGMVPVKKDSLGNPIANTASISGGSSALTASDNRQTAATMTADPLGTEIDRLAGLGSEVMPAKGSKNAADGTNQDYAKLLIGSKEYSGASDTDKAAMLKDVLLGTSTKDINSSLTDGDKLALMQHHLQGSKQDVWMENNDNAFAYYRAEINNGKANGTITQKDLDLSHTGSLAQKYTIAKVNQENHVSQELINGYADTSKTEFEKLADGSDAKNQLIAYDEALAKAGLPPKYQNKYGGYGKVSGSGGKAKREFAFASLPASLVGTGAGGSNGGGKGYKDAAPTFKPIADLRAPAPAIPKGRTISFKKGIQL